MTASPRPVAPAEPMEFSQNIPAPTIGESPMRPGIFQLRPLVEVHAAMSPLASTAEQ